MSESISADKDKFERPNESYARRWLYLTLTRQEAELLKFTTELGEWYLSNFLENWDSVEEDVSASWDASRDSAPAWSELDELSKGACVGTYAAECAISALGRLLEWDVTSLCPDADSCWRSFQLD